MGGRHNGSTEEENREGRHSLTLSLSSLTTNAWDGETEKERVFGQHFVGVTKDEPQAAAVL